MTAREGRKEDWERARKGEEESGSEVASSMSLPASEELV